MNKINSEKTEKHISCGIIPVYKKLDGTIELLLVQANHGGISFPKGHMEKGESFLQTAERELFEETALVCQKIDQENIISEKYIIQRPSKVIEKTVHYFIGFVSSKDVIIQTSEIKNYFWLQVDEAIEKINHIESKQVCKQAIALLEK